LVQAAHGSADAVNDGAVIEPWLHFHVLPPDETAPVLTQYIIFVAIALYFKAVASGLSHLNTEIEAGRRIRIVQPTMAQSIDVLCKPLGKLAIALKNS